MKARLDDIGADFGQLGDLMPDRLGVLAVQLVAAPPALRRLAVDNPAKLLGRDERAVMTAMAGLPAPFLARRRGRRPSLDRGGIGGGKWKGKGKMASVDGVGSMRLLGQRLS